MIQHDMMMFDHGMPRADGTLSKEQRPEADVNIEFQSQLEVGRGVAEARVGLSRRRTRSTRPTIRRAVGQHMTNTDSAPFQDLVPAISLRENERGTQIGAGWDPHWHQPTDVFATLQRQGFPARPERRADDAVSNCPACRRDNTDGTILIVSFCYYLVS